MRKNGDGDLEVVCGVADNVEQDSRDDCSQDDR